jgi:hypothetical protein
MVDLYSAQLQAFQELDAALSAREAQLKLGTIFLLRMRVAEDSSKVPSRNARERRPGARAEDDRL